MIQTRIRTVKPEFFRHAELNQRPPEQRLLFIGLWCMADREGRLDDDAPLIRVLVAPTMSEPAVEEGIAALTERGFLRRYEARGGRRYIQVVNFRRHQRIDSRESASQRPAPPEPEENHADESPDEAPTGHRRDTDGTPKREGEGEREGEREGEGEGTAAARPPLTLTGDPGTTAGRDGTAPRPTARQTGASGSGRTLKAVPSATETAEQLLDAYHRLCSGLPKVQDFHATRRKHAAARLREHPLAWWEAVFTRASASRFLCGGAKPGPGRSRPFKADFDWFIANAANGVKVAEGKYDNDGDGEDYSERRERRRL